MVISHLQVAGMSKRVQFFYVGNGLTHWLWCDIISLQEKGSAALRLSLLFCQVFTLLFGVMSHETVINALCVVDNGCYECVMKEPVEQSVTKSFLNFVNNELIIISTKHLQMFTMSNKCYVHVKGWSYTGWIQLRQSQLRVRQPVRMTPPPPFVFLTKCTSERWIWRTGCWGVQGPEDVSLQPKEHVH